LRLACFLCMPFMEDTELRRDDCSDRSEIDLALLKLLLFLGFIFSF